MFKWLRDLAKEFLTVLHLLRKGGEKGMAQLLALNIMMAEMAFADVPKNVPQGSSQATKNFRCSRVGIHDTGTTQATS